LRCEHPFVLSPNDKGAIAEMKIATAAVELGVPVLRPVTEHCRFDLAFEVSGRLLRVQCKWGRLIREGSVIQVKLQSSRCTPAGDVRASYTDDELDLLGVYCGELDRCYLLPRELAVRRNEISLRVTPPLNGQRACLNTASEFEFPGAIAQLGEHLSGTQGVAGSSPASSTPLRTEVGCHEFRNHFGFYLERAATGDEVLVRRRGRPYARLIPA
jgi:prevent-host-death family protein